MYTDQERLERAEIIGAKLIEYRPAVLLTLRIKYGLQDDVAEDIYSDTCCYMLSRGVELINVTAAMLPKIGILGASLQMIMILMGGSMTMIMS
jgi:hypothetical protein